MINNENSEIVFIKMKKTITSNPTDNFVLREGEIYKVTVDLFGAVWYLCGNGVKLNIPPKSFEFLDAPERVLRLWATEDHNIRCTLDNRAIDDNIDLDEPVYLITESQLEQIKYEAQALDVEWRQRLCGANETLANALGDMARELYEITKEVEKRGTTLKVSEVRRDEREKVYDEHGILYGEAAKRFYEELENPTPPTPEAREIIRSAIELSKKIKLDSKNPFGD